MLEVVIRQVSLYRKLKVLIMKTLFLMQTTF